MVEVKVGDVRIRVQVRWLMVGWWVKCWLGALLVVQWMAICWFMMLLN